MGHGAPGDEKQTRTKDSDVEKWYTKSVFDQDDATASDSSKTQG